MSLIQVLLLCGLLLAGLLACLVLKKQLLTRLFFLGQFVLGCVWVVWPDLATQVASWVGVGRGTDLVLYFLVVFVYVGGLCVLGKFRQLERRQTLMVRELAIRGAEWCGEK